MLLHAPTPTSALPDAFEAKLKHLVDHRATAGCLVTSSATVDIHLDELSSLHTLAFSNELRNWNTGVNPDFLKPLKV